MVTLGIIADTHIPDRTEVLHPKVLTTFENANVNMILHAGDVSKPEVIEELERTAPSFAVKGNRDIWMMNWLPVIRIIHIGGVQIALTHGHFNFWIYWFEKLLFYTKKYSFWNYVPILRRYVPKTDVIVFGHSHQPTNIWLDGTLFFNPGSPNVPGSHYPPSVGLLHIHGCDIRGEIIWLN